MKNVKQKKSPELKQNNMNIKYMTHKIQTKFEHNVTYNYKI